MATRRPWYAVPLTLLVIGTALAGLAFWRILNRPSSPSTNLNANQRVVAPDSQCGDGICQDVACLSTGCPVPETPATCPADCASDVVESTGSGGANENAQVNQNINAAGGALDFALEEQTLEQKRTCPLEDANLTPAEAVALAQRAGLMQGTGDVNVRLTIYPPPLEQCVWYVKNYLTASSGRQVVIIDATQEIYLNADWKDGR
ncbi:MAG: hypothetical protein HY567_03695 [Candidatus Kerfeldbacteria bacterium]|nr:hypothetical protein [Candidatus Kerfeldbacteria bacterium]